MSSSSKSITEWLAEGESLYAQSVSQLQSLESQLAEIEERMASQLTEVNKLAEILGKPPTEGRRIVTAQVVGNVPGENGHTSNGTPSTGQSIPNSPATIARALTGRGLGR